MGSQFEGGKGGQRALLQRWRQQQEAVGHIVPTAPPQRGWKLGLGSLLPFSISVQNRSPWSGAALLEGGSSVLSGSVFTDTVKSELCTPGDSNPVSLKIKMNHHTAPACLVFASDLYTFILLEQKTQVEFQKKNLSLAKR